MMEIPEGYNHKATSESFNREEKATIYYSDTEGSYLLVLGNPEYESLFDLVYLSKTQLELLVHAGTDVLDNLNHG